MTNRERVIAALRHATHPLDDDELARRTEITPRQTVNQVCRRLEVEGRLARLAGPDGKIVNQLRDQATAIGAAVAGASTVAVAGAGTVPAGSSAEQRLAERHMLDALGDRLGVRLDPRTINRGEGVHVEIDGTDAALTVLVECWAHQGPAKVAQKYKLVNDALKLHWIALPMTPSPRKILCVSDAAAVRHLRGRSWQGQAIRDLGIEIEIVTLPEAVRDSVAAAQARQFR